MRRLSTAVAIASLLVSTPVSMARACHGMASHRAFGCRCHRVYCPPPRPHAPPVATDDSFVTPMNSALSFAAPGVLANDYSQGGGPLFVIALTAPSHGTANLYSNGAITYIPGPNFTGSDSFTYVVSDGVCASNWATVRIHVLPPDAVPVANNDSYTLAKNTMFRTPAPGVLSNDSSPAGRPLSVFSFTPPAHGTAAVASDGSFSYTPVANFTGSDSFSYIATDGANRSNIARVSLTITDAGTSGTPVTPP